ncbi:MAG: hypothetical protein NOF05_15815 [Candidatus Accumulibacter phosphatis]|uniref:hypothetical protein n=1 Tax=Accumulibacter sp. TaxID=2053492 RepID=UPI00044EBB8A|nr:hypothetical protein [Accumulibacter sp.]MCM8623826.1 hypothetical protein [Accumulibacter sp.]MCQ1550241.1 hypothetical protein [Candidatus Accumulibacter phosphatis]
MSALPAYRLRKSWSIPGFSIPGFSGFSRFLCDSWATLRDTLSVQRRVTATFNQRDGRSLHVRKATVAEPDLMAIYRALGITAAPGGTRKLTI